MVSLRSGRGDAAAGTADPAASPSPRRPPVADVSAASPSRRRTSAAAAAAASPPRRRRQAGAPSPPSPPPARRADADAGLAATMLQALTAAFGGEGAAAAAHADDRGGGGSDDDGGPSTSSSSDESDAGADDGDGREDTSHRPPAPLVTPWRPSLRLPRPPKAAAAVAALAARAPPAPGPAAPLGAEGRVLTLPPPAPPGPAEDKRAAAAWFALPAPPGGVLTDEQKRDLRLLKLRGALDPARHYRAPDSTKLPARFAIGTVIEGAGEWHSARLSRKARGRTLADELLADGGAAAVRKRRYGALQAQAGRWAGRKGSKPSIGGAPRLKRRKAKPKH